MGRGIIKVSLASMKDILQLPADYNLLYTYYQNHKEALCIVVEHPDIPTNARAQPTLVPWYKTIRTEHGPVIQFIRMEHTCSNTMARLLA